MLTEIKIKMHLKRCFCLNFFFFIFLHLKYTIRSLYAMNSYGIGANAIGTGGFLITTPRRGCFGWRFNDTHLPLSLASFNFRSFSLTRRKKSSRHFEWSTCSMRTLIRFGRIFPRTRLLTIIPTACGVTLYTRPVFPWYALYGIPFCTAPLPWNHKRKEC